MSWIDSVVLLNDRTRLEVERAAEAVASSFRRSLDQQRERGVADRRRRLRHEAIRTAVRTQLQSRKQIERQHNSRGLIARQKEDGQRLTEKARQARAEGPKPQRANAQSTRAESIREQSVREQSVREQAPKPESSRPSREPQEHPDRASATLLRPPGSARRESRPGASGSDAASDPQELHDEQAAADASSEPSAGSEMGVKRTRTRDSSSRSSTKAPSSDGSSRLAADPSSPSAEAREAVATTLDRAQVAELEETPVEEENGLEEADSGSREQDSAPGLNALSQASDSAPIGPTALQVEHSHKRDRGENKGGIELSPRKLRDGDSRDRESEHGSAEAGNAALPRTEQEIQSVAAVSLGQGGEGQTTVSDPQRSEGDSPAQARMTAETIDKLTQECVKAIHVHLSTVRPRIDLTLDLGRLGQVHARVERRNRNPRDGGRGATQSKQEFVESVDKDGVSVRFETSNPEANLHLQRALPDLDRRLRDHEVEVVDLTVGLIGQS